MVVFDRGSQILLLKEKFPKLKSTGFRPTVFTIPLNTFYGTSDCIIELTIPKDYPVKNVSFKLINRIPHKWSEGDSVVLPNHLYEKPLVDILWEVVSNFEDYDEYLSAKKLNRDDKTTGAKYVECLPRLKQDIVFAINNPPQSSLPSIKSLSESRTKEILNSDSELYKLIYRCENLSDIAKDTKTRLYKNEESLTTLIRNSKELENLISDLKENINYLEKHTEDPSHLLNLDPKQSLKKAVKREVCVLEDKINRRKEAVKTGKKKYKDLKDDLFKLYKKLNLLYTFSITIEDIQS